jgi:cell wall assembly regulator SMI1
MQKDGGIPGFVPKGPELSEADVGGLEARLGIKLPADYRAFLQATNGGRVRPNNIDVPGLPGGEAEVNNFLGIGTPIVSSSIVWSLETLSQRLDGNWLPFAHDSGGNAYCFSLRAADFGSVAYCDLQSVFAMYDVKPQFYPLARNFTEFMSRLRPSS